MQQRDLWSQCRRRDFYTLNVKKSCLLLPLPSQRSKVVSINLPILPFLKTKAVVVILPTFGPAFARLFWAQGPTPELSQLPRLYTVCCTYSYVCRAILSLGFTTSCPGPGYSVGDLSRLLPLMAERRITAPLTVPLRASLLQRSGPEVIHFLQKVRPLTCYRYSQRPCPWLYLNISASSALKEGGKPAFLCNLPEREFLYYAWLCLAFLEGDVHSLTSHQAARWSSLKLVPSLG